VSTLYGREGGSAGPRGRERLCRLAVAPAEAALARAAAKHPAWPHRAEVRRRAGRAGQAPLARLRQPVVP